MRLADRPVEQHHHRRAGGIGEQRVDRGDQIGRGQRDDGEIDRGMRGQPRGKPARLPGKGDRGKGHDDQAVDGDRGMQLDMLALHLLIEQRIFRHDQERDTEQARKVDDRLGRIAAPEGRPGKARQDRKRRQQQHREFHLVGAREIERVDQRITDQHRGEKACEQPHVHHARLALAGDEARLERGIEEAPAARARYIERVVILLHRRSLCPGGPAMDAGD